MILPPLVFPAKTFRIHNILKMDRFHNKLASFGLDKHTSQNKQTFQLRKESVRYELATDFESSLLPLCCNRIVHLTQTQELLCRGMGDINFPWFPLFITRCSILKMCCECMAERKRQGILTEKEGSVQLTSLYKLVMIDCFAY